MSCKGYQIVLVDASESSHHDWSRLADLISVFSARY